MKTDDFDYPLPPELIAQQPLDERAASRLLVLEQEHLSDQHFADLPNYLQAGDLLVMNDTRVIPARLHLHKASGGRVEVMLERFIDQTHVLALARSNKSLKAGTELMLEGEYDGQAVMHFVAREGVFFKFKLSDGLDGEALFLQHGHIPLPPYIDRPDSEQDQHRYQTVYAQNNGAVAAPTAGLHFDQALLQTIEQLGVETANVTLHVGAGTFQPVKVDDVTSHQMHSEWVEVPASTAQKVQACKARGGRVIAVGTTSVRALESAAQSAAKLTLIEPYSGDTRLFIYPGYEFKVVDALITNFHLPKSTLLMMISAFAGKQLIRAAYQHAIEQRYRFFSYGDAMLIMPSADHIGSRSLK